MTEALAHQVERAVEQVHELYHRLVLLVGPARSGKTKALQKVSARTSAPLINVNLEVSRGMLDLTERKRALELPRLLGEIVSRATGDLVLLDNTEILFDVNLRQDPLRLLQGLSRNKTIVAAWNGCVVDDRITYAVPGHPEHRRYAVRESVLVNAGLRA